jgi:hypothetical protein
MYFSGKTWNNGSRHSSGAGYGIKLSLFDREANFSPDWGIVLLFLEGNHHPIEVNVAKESSIKILVFGFNNTVSQHGTKVSRTKSI